ncbi:MAG: acyl carrier protein [Candidatus Omnitrophica bacterium]|nr:acyl carrier protein [Candidatus Omnitrophota bacterium]
MADTGGINIKQEIQTILSKILNRPSEEITDDARFVEDLGMDSIMSIEILASIEKKFKITIPDEEIKKVASLRQAIELAEKYIRK